MIAATFRAIDAAGLTELITDDGVVLHASPEVVQASVYRRLRVGQRVAVDVRDQVVLSIEFPQSTPSR